MLDIKNKLKLLGITLADFANKLGISRPTLDNYIDMYEQNIVIPKEKYQSIFERLFSRDIDNKENFLKILESCHNLIERDRLLGTFELEAGKTDIINSVIEEMKKDMYSNNSDDDIYIFINMCIRSYKREKIFKKIARYFLILNGVKSLDAVAEDEYIYLSNYYKLFYEDKNDLLEINKEYNDLFFKKIKEIKEQGKKKKEMLEKMLIEKVKEKIQDSLSLGIDFEDLKINSILNNIKFDDDELLK